MKKIFILLFASIVFINCKDSVESETKLIDETIEQEIELSDVEQTIKAVEKAHDKEVFMNQDVIKFDIDLNFGGQDRLDATMYISTDSKYVRIDKKDGSSLIYDGDQVWLTPEDADSKGARFDIFTWSYFFSLPFKLNDPGTVTELLQETESQRVIKLTFEKGTGDAPDDWYEIYINKENNKVDYAGYIVTYGGTSVEKAANNAHAIGYEAYQKLDGVSIAHKWKFYNYSNTVDTSTVIGDAVLTNLDFITMDNELFAKPENAIEVKQ